MVFCGSGGTATGPEEGAMAGGASCAESGCFGVVVVVVGFLVLAFAVLVGAGAALDWALTFFRQLLREEALFSVWQ